MAAGNLVLGREWATIEVDDTSKSLDFNKTNGFLVHKSGDPVFLQMGGDGSAIPVTDAEVKGTIRMEAGDSAPLPNGPGKVFRQCAATQSAKLQFFPSVS
ncbi:hypothetical protein LCGC14_0401510 [marine sediment metagenome]|uniref:Uncharacterized protein n=1 Tax=marine sediment metagenome TaxID=412755 RepID=A0A0F9W5Q2_9ZZZZ